MKDYPKILSEIFSKHRVNSSDTFDPEREVIERVAYLGRYMVKYGIKNLVLGISGGVDSTTAGRICKLACENSDDYTKTKHNFVAVRLPYGVQADENDAKEALDFIKPDIVKVVNIKGAVDAMNFEVIDNEANSQSDFHKGNLKARIRMAAQYHVAANLSDGPSIVVGTDHNSELVPAFYTKWGDQACDITVLDGLNKRQVRMIAEYLGAPASLFKKVATADLEDNKPLLPDEEALGFSYDHLDDFLEGKNIPEDVKILIAKKYDSTRHKRTMPVSFGNYMYNRRNF